MTLNQNSCPVLFNSFFHVTMPSLKAQLLGMILYSLEIPINILVGINVLVGIFVKINKRTGWNKRTGGKIEPKYCLIILILLVNFLLSFEF